MTSRVNFYVGTYTGPIKFGTGRILEGKGEGIYLLELELKSGALEQSKVFPGIVNPSYLALSPDQAYLYAVNELKEYEGKASGSVSAFSVSADDCGLKFLNKQATGGTDPCHVIVNPEGSHIFVSNFMSGSVAVLPVKTDGSLEPISQFIQHEGSGVDPHRQTGPHAHSTVFSPDGEFAFVPDLGLDKLVIYKTRSKGKPLEENEPGYFETKPGAGPRHCAFNPSGKFCYLINELDCTIVVLAYNTESGGFTELQTVSSLPEGLVVPGNSCADVHITPDGRFLYGSNRGHNSLVIYCIDTDSGLLDYVDCQPCGGEIPRNFTIDPTGKYLLCANQDSDIIVVFRIEQQSGKLDQVSEITVPTPVCVIPVE